MINIKILYSINSLINNLIILHKSIILINRKSQQSKFNINSENETHKKLPTNIDMELVVKNTIIYISSLRKLNAKREKIYKNMIYDL